MLTRLEYMRFFVENGTSDLKRNKRRCMNPLCTQGIDCLDSWKEMMNAETPQRANGGGRCWERKMAKSKVVVCLATAAMDYAEEVRNKLPDIDDTGKLGFELRFTAYS